MKEARGEGMGTGGVGWGKRMYDMEVLTSCLGTTLGSPFPGSIGGLQVPSCNRLLHPLALVGGSSLRLVFTATIQQSSSAHPKQESILRQNQLVGVEQYALELDSAVQAWHCEQFGCIPRSVLIPDEQHCARVWLHVTCLVLQKAKALMIVTTAALSHAPMLQSCCNAQSNAQQAQG